MARHAKSDLVAAILSFVIAATTPSAAAADDDFLADIELVKAHMNDPAWRIVDVRPAEAYQSGHIPGAVNIPIDEFFDAPPNHDLIAPIDKIQKAMSGHAIDNATTVVFYDKDEFYDAARAFWVLEVYGHDKLRLLDGGFKAWQAAELTVSTTVPKLAHRTFIPTVAPDRLATKLSTRLAIDNPNVLLVDARTRPEYEARVSHGARYGHIPSALSYPTDELFVEIDGVKIMKAPDTLRQIYAALPADKKVITYCNIGKKSALVYFNLRRLGYDAANYDGSWHEWSLDGSLPIEPTDGATR